MYSRELIEEQAFLGAAAELKNVCKVQPLTISEIISMGTDKYYQYLGLLLLDEVTIQKMIKEQSQQEIPLEDIKPLQYLLQNAEMNDQFLLELMTAFSIFIKEEILLLPKINSIVVGNPKNKRLITMDNFVDFQFILRVQNNREVPELPPENESEIAKKFRLKREARDAAKKKQQQKNGSSTSFVDLLVVGEVFGIDVNNKTLFAFYKLLERYQAREKWDNDIQMLCAGADSQKIKTKYWGGNLKDE